MFWYNRKTIEGLRRIATSFTQTEKCALQNEYKSFMNGGKLVFNKNDDIFIIDNELMFIKCLVKVANDKETILTNISVALESSQLRFSSGTIINEQGACALVQEEMIADKKFIRKTTLQREIKPEFEILSYLNKLENDYVIRVIKNSFDGKSFLMEPAQASLETYIEAHFYLEEKERIEIVNRIIDCVAFIHSKDIIHRDLHPGNFLLVRSVNTSIWKLSDFGFACRYDDASMLTNDINKRSYGRHDYTAPEQLESLSNSSFKSDIYSIGKLINFIMRKSPNKNAHNLNVFSEKCCRKNPDDRYESILVIKRLIDNVISKF